MKGNTPDGQNVYIIEHEHGYVKIGVSKNPVGRMSELQTGCPYKLTLLGEIYADEPFKVEKNLHERFKIKQTRGEWYDLNTRERGRLLVLTDLNKNQVNRRYAKTTEKRRKLTLTMQGLVG